MRAQIDIENQATIARITCGWKKAELPLEAVRRYWRDVHSPAIARRAGIWEYRHSQFAPVKPDLLPPVAGVTQHCDAQAQLMWLSDVRYADEAGLRAFGESPDGAAKALLLQDIELIVDRSSTYKAVGDDARTLLDRTGVATPQGPAMAGSYAIFLRQRTPGPEGERDLHRCARALASRWAGLPGVLRLRLNVFEAPDMEAEKRGGYPIKTHPIEQQYQAWIDLMLADDATAARLIEPGDGGEGGGRGGLAAAIGAIHVYPVEHLYTFNYAGRATLAGLRGYCAWEAMTRLGATNHRDPGLLAWMYGELAQGRTGETP